MTNLVIPFAEPDITEEEIAAVGRVLRSGWLSSGPEVKYLEANVAGALNVNHAVAFSSLTAAVRPTLTALGLGEGHEVIVPAWTFSSPVMELMHQGCTPVIVDVDPARLMIDPDAVRAAVTSETRAIMVTHFAGLPAPMAEIYEIADDHHLKVIEDAAHAWGTTLGGVPIGHSASEAVLFSLYATKPVAAGEGGLAVVQDEKAAATLRAMRWHGVFRDMTDRYSNPRGSWYYDVAVAGFKANMPDPLAALANVQLHRAPAMLARRTEIAQQYLAGLGGLGEFLELPAQPAAYETHSWHLFVVRVNGGISRDTLIERLRARGVVCSVHFRPLLEHTFWKSFQREETPVAKREFERVISLPISSGLTCGQVERVIEVMRDEIQALAGR